jgi:hypothetical protein
MRVAGIAVRIHTRKRPSAELVVLEGLSPVVVLESHSFTADDTDLCTQLHDAAEAMRSHLRDRGLERVVVRRADHPPKPSNAEGPRLRLLTEGAVASAARSVVVDTRIGTGRETGAWYGGTKATLEFAASNLINGVGLPPLYLGSAAAALAALSLP